MYRETFEAMRKMALDIVPAQIGLQPSQDLPHVFGAVMDSGIPEGVFTLVALADGTTSLYTSSGGGVIGGGGHESVVRETKAFLAALERQLNDLEDDSRVDEPPPERVVIYALTYSGRKRAEGAVEDFGYNRHRLSPVFHAAHSVITELRRTSESPRKDPEQPPPRPDQ